MLFMNQDKIYGRTYREESGGDGDDGAGGASNSGGKEPTVAELQEQLNSMTGERDSLNGKVNELLGETKKAKQERKTADTAAAEAARKQAEADGNYQELFNSSEAQRQELASQLEELTTSVHTKEVRNAALTIATELADGENVGLLAEFVQRRLKFAEDGIKVTDEKGGLTVSSLDDLKKEFAGSARYSSLIKGNQSSGGGASGGSSGGSATKEMTRSDFDRLDPIAKSKFMKDGGKLIR